MQLQGYWFGGGVITNGGPWRSYALSSTVVMSSEFSDLHMHYSPNDKIGRVHYRQTDLRSWFRIALTAALTAGLSNWPAKESTTASVYQLVKSTRLRRRNCWWVFNVNQNAFIIAPRAEPPPPYYPHSSPDQTLKLQTHLHSVNSCIIPISLHHETNDYLTTSKPSPYLPSCFISHWVSKKPWPHTNGFSRRLVVPLPMLIASAMCESEALADQYR